MTEPRRLLELHERDAMGALLRSARLDEPPASALARATDAAVLAARGASSIVPPANGPFGRVVWGAGVGLASIALLIIGVALLGRRGDEAVRAEQPLAHLSWVAPAVRMEEAPPPEAPKTDVAPQAEREAPRRAPSVAPSHRAPAPSASNPPSDDDSLSAELRAIDAALAALSGGDAAKSLSLLDAYAKRFPRGQLRLEATVARIEALAKSGARAEATAIAERLLAAQPNSPYAARIRALLGLPRPSPSAPESSERIP